MKRIILYLFLLLFLNQISLAQNNFSFFLGGGYVLSLDNTKLPYWENGIAINFTSDFKITDKIGIYFSASFQKLFFISNLVFFVSPAVIGYRPTINGENSNIYDFSIGGKIFLSSSIIKPYIGLGTGLLLINQGKVEIYPETNKNYCLSQINFNLGIEVEIIHHLSLVLDGKLITSFTGPSYFPIIAAIKFNL